MQSSQITCRYQLRQIAMVAMGSTSNNNKHGVEFAPQRGSFAVASSTTTVEHDDGDELQDEDSPARFRTTTLTLSG